MNNPNPFLPQGSLLEKQNSSRSRLKLAVFCVIAVGSISLTAMLIQGCKRNEPASEVLTTETAPTNSLTTTTFAVDTNTVPATNVLTTSVPPTNAIYGGGTAVTPVTETTTTAAATIHTVVKGDMFVSIAKKYGVKLAALQAANPGVDSTKLKIGQKINIPAPTTASATTVGTAVDTSNLYVVKSGDTLSKIATAHGTTVKALQAANNLTTTRINVGQKLKLPAKAVATPVPPVADPVPFTPPPPMTTVPTTAPADTAPVR